jgi:hypothetical protein
LTLAAKRPSTVMARVRPSFSNSQASEGDPTGPLMTSWSARSAGD